MKIGGVLGLTLIDYPGKVACTVFTVGCNFRCPFCHNPELVLVDNPDSYGKKEEKKFFEFLKRRKNKLDGVCITGGEPTVQPDIVEFMKKIKRQGFLVKLDTNGTNSEVLRRAIREKAVDYIAMDIKNCLSKYKKTCGVDVDTAKIKKSVELIRKSKLPYEFRTTAVPGIHVHKDFERIGRWLKGAENYALQYYVDEGKILDEKLKKRIGDAKIDLERVKKKIQKYFGSVEIR